MSEEQIIEEIMKNNKKLNEQKKLTMLLNFELIQKLTLKKYTLEQLINLLEIIPNDIIMKELKSRKKEKSDKKVSKKTTKHEQFCEIK